MAAPGDTLARASGRAAGQLERSLKALTIGVAQQQERRAQALSMATGEYEQQVRVAISGNAALAWAHTEKKVNWRLPFLYAPAQRQVPFRTPQFYYGVEWGGQAPDDLVIFQVQLNGWTQNGKGWIVGANLRFAACAPTVNGTTKVPFKATVHLTFQGYAAHPEGGPY